MASTIKIKNSTTTGSAPSSLAQGEFAINVADGNLFYGDGSSVKQNFVFDDLTVKGNLTAEQYIVSSSVTYMTQSFSSGSTIFGDTLDDTHLFTGSVDITGQLSIPGFSDVSASLASAVAGGDDLGSHTATQDLDMGTNAITNVGNVDGVDVSTLKSDFDTLEGKTLISSSTQISFDNITDVPPGLLSSSADFATAAQGTLADTAIQPSDTGSFSTATGVEDNADVTDATNVQAAGALMDSEVTNLDQVKSFDSSDYATAAQGTLADTAIQPSDTGSFLTTVAFDDVTDKPALISSSAQVDHDATTNFSADEHFTQANITTVGTVTAGDVSAILPTGTVSGSSQIDLGSASGTIDISDQTNLAGGTNLTLSGDTMNLDANISLTSITASGDISSSGNISGNSLHINGTTKNIIASTNGFRISSYTDLKYLESTGNTLQWRTNNDSIFELRSQNGSADDVYIHLEHADAPLTNVSIGTNQASGSFFIARGEGFDTNKDFTITGSNGYVGINEPNPTEQLSVNGNISASGALIGNTLTAAGLDYPTADGDNGDVLITDGAGNLSFARTTVYANVKNVHGSELVKGMPVHVTGAAGNTSEVVAASASNAATMPAHFILNETLADDAEGLAIAVGYINHVNTGDFNEGDTVYVGADGGYTNVKPTGSNLIQNLGIVDKVHASNGSGFILGAGRSNDVPNIASGYAWVGNSDSVATAVATSSFIPAGTISSSAQITITESQISDLTHYTDSDVKSKLNTEAVVSGSATQVRTFLNVEDGADVTDTANVTTAGALMDSEVTNLAQVKSFDSSDYATAAQGILADTAIQPSDTGSFLTTVAFADVTGKPTLISSSAQVDHDATTNFSADEHFTQANITTVGTVTSGDVSAILPSGTVSGSAQIDIDSTTGTITSAKISDVDAFSQSGTYASLRAQGTTAGDVGLGNVTNESKATMFTNAALTGNPTAPTQTGTDDSTKIATTAFVQDRIDDIIGNAGSTLDTLGELSASLSDDQDALTSLTTTVGTKLAKASNLSDLTNAATARTNLGVDAAGTDNSTDVTLAGSYDYITISGQEITRNQIDASTDISNLTTTNVSEGTNEYYTDTKVKSKLNTENVVSGSASDVRTFLNVEDGADVTDATNVQAAGALMDSEVTNLSQVKSFDSSDYATAAQGTKADTAIQPSQTGSFSTATGVENNADVTDTANVTAAGALMDSEVTNLDQVKSFDSSDYATAAQGTKADTAIQPADTGSFSTATGVENNADVTDTANVTAAGALMDSEVTSLDLIKGLTAAQISGAFNAASASLASDIPTNNNQLTNGAGYITGYTVTSGDVTAHVGDIDHDSLLNFSADEHFTQANITTVGTVTSGDVSAILPAGTVSGSAQTVANISGQDITAENITANQTLRTTKTGSVTDPALLIGANSGYVAGNNTGIILEELVPGTTFFVPYFVSNGAKIFGFGTVMQMEKNLDMQSNRIYFDSDSTNTYIASNADDPEDLEIHADQDVILNPDGQVIANSNISSSGTLTANTIEVNTDIDITTNNEFLRGKLTGGATRNLIGVNSSNIVEVGNTTSPSIQLNNDTSIEGNLEVTGSITLEGLNVIDEAKFKVGETSTTAGDGNGIIIREGSTATTAGKIYYYLNTGEWALTDADAEASATGLLGVALGDNSGTKGMLLQGCVTLATDPGTTGDILYLQTDTAGDTGDATSTAPSGTNDIVRIIGYCINNAKIYFNPSNDFIKHT